MFINRRGCLALGAGAALLGRAGWSAATATPAARWQAQRPVRFIVPFAAGGASDVFARLISEPMGRSLGQPLVIENRPGGGGVSAADFVAKSPADGYTVLMATPGTQITNPFLMPSLPYDPMAAFELAAPLFLAPNILVVSKDVPAASLTDFIALAKQKKGALSFSSSGVGSTSHLAGELFKMRAGVEATHVPYRGSSPAMTDLVAGRVDFTIDTISTVLPYIRSGQLRALATAGAEPHPELPDVEPIARALAGFEASAINYVVLPKGTPAAAVDTLEQAVRESLHTPATRKRIGEMGYFALTDSRKELAERVERERQKWKTVIQAARITL